jgi:Ca2+-binding EF-hand superfamily protein
MRHALVLSVCVIFAGGCTGKVVDTNTREHLISGYRSVLKSWDKNGDGKLNRAEVASMIDGSFRKIKTGVLDDKNHPELELQRREITILFQDQDTNRDGYLALDELS